MGQDNNNQEFTHVGLECRIVKQDLGHWCGYVRRPESVEPVRWTTDYDSKHDELLNAEVDVWGGITYGPDEDGWVGFDDAHADSITEHRDQDTSRLAVKAETKDLAEQIAELNENDPNREPGDGESYDGEGGIRPVPPGVENELEDTND